MNQVIEDILKLRDYHWRINNIAVETDLDPELPNVMADYFQMQQVILNIVLNAEQSMTKSARERHVNKSPAGWWERSGHFFF